MRRAQGDGNCGSSFSTSCHVWRDVVTRCRHDNRCVGHVLHRKARHGSTGDRGAFLRIIIYRFRGEGTTADITERLATRAGQAGLRPLALAVPPPARRRVLLAFVSLALQITGSWGDQGILPAGGFLEPGARRLREHRVPAIPLALLAGRKRTGCSMPWRGRRGARPCCCGGGAQARFCCFSGSVPVARRGGPNLPLVPVGRAAARDRTPGGACYAPRSCGRVSCARAALDGDAVAVWGARVRLMFLSGSRSSRAAIPRARATAPPPRPLVRETQHEHGTSSSDRRMLPAS